jgi:hypothetical protein
MNGKRARRVRRAVGYKKAPDQLVERGGIREKDGKLVFQFARNPEANRYRWWKRGVVSGMLAPELVNHLGHRQELRLTLGQVDQSSGEENE